MRHLESSQRKTFGSCSQTHPEITDPSTIHTNCNVGGGEVHLRTLPFFTGKPTYEYQNRNFKPQVSFFQEQKSVQILQGKLKNTVIKILIENTTDRKQTSPFLCTKYHTAPFPVLSIEHTWTLEFRGIHPKFVNSLDWGAQISFYSISCQILMHSFRMFLAT